MKRYVRVLAVLVLLCLLLPVFGVSAAEGFSYTYNTDGSSVAVPAPYETITVVSGDAFGGKLSEPEDFYATEEEIFILDSGNSRVVVLSDDLTFLREIRLTGQGAPAEFSEALGICVDHKGCIYIADKGAQKVYVSDGEGNLLRTIDAPPADKVEENFEYTPSKVAVDTAGVIYVISANTYSGALQYEPDGSFIGFYGAERVAVTAELLWNEFWKEILSESAASGIKRSVPTSFIGFDLDRENFVYTIKGGTGEGVGQIRKLNPLGTNVLFGENLQQEAFGDLETHFDSQKNLTIQTTFCDLVVDDAGFITALDSTRNRLFQYDQNSNLLFAFGGSGDTFGTYETPVAVETQGGCLLVLDRSRGSISLLKPTFFGSNVREALSLFGDGRYEDAKAPWEAVLQVDANYELANTGMGKLFEKLGDYKSAVAYYERANNKQGYSDAFALRRDEQMRAGFVWILIGVVAALLLLVGVVIYAEHHPKDEYAISRKAADYPFYVTFHPFKGYEELKYSKLGSILASLICLFVFFLSTVMSGQLRSFHFDRIPAEEFNLFLTLASTIGLFVLFVVCNWASSTLMDGEGNFKEIWCFTSYALIPYIITQVVATVSSHFFSLDESAFYGVIWTVGILWTAAVLFMAIKEAHQYTFGKTILVFLITLLGMYLVLIIATIAYSMFAQLLSFIVMVYNELRLKIM